MEALRKVSLIAAMVGAVGSVCLMLMSGLRPPVFLLVLFVGWVTAPFLALVSANVASPQWSVFTRYSLYGVMLVITTSSLAIYGYMLIRPLASQPAFPYVAVPIGSTVFSAIALTVAALISHNRDPRGGQKT